MTVENKRKAQFPWLVFVSGLILVLLGAYVAVLGGQYDGFGGLGHGLLASAVIPTGAILIGLSIFLWIVRQAISRPKQERVEK